MVKPCTFLRLVRSKDKDDGMKTEVVIRTDSIQYINCACGCVFIEYKCAEDESIMSHMEEYDSEKVAFERFYMILRIMGAVGQIDIAKYVNSANNVKWKKVE